MDLLDGLSTNPDSLYRVWLNDHLPPSDGAEAEPKLGWMGFNQNTALLLEIRNLLHIDFVQNRTDKGRDPDVHVILPPGKQDEKPAPVEVEATSESMQAFLAQF